MWRHPFRVLKILVEGALVFGMLLWIVYTGLSWVRDPS